MKLKRCSLKLILSLVFLNALLFSHAQEKYSSNKQLGTLYKGSFQLLKTLASPDGACSALTPEGWVISGVSPQGNALDLVTLDKSMYAGYLNVGVPGSKAYNDKSFTTPLDFIETTVSESGRVKVKWGKPLKDELGLTILPFEVQDPREPRQGKGIIFYQVSSVPGDVYGYIIEMFTAQTFRDQWESHGAEAIAASLSIRCTANLTKYKGNSSYRRIDVTKIEANYNRELGMEYVHDPVSKVNYWVNQKMDKSTEGNLGMGYFLRKENEVKKLIPGKIE